MYINFSQETPLARPIAGRDLRFDREYFQGADRALAHALWPTLTIRENAYHP